MTALNRRFLYAKDDRKLYFVMALVSNICLIFDLLKSVE